MYVFLKGVDGVCGRLCVRLPERYRQGALDGKRFEWLGTAPLLQVSVFPSQPLSLQTSTEWWLAWLGK